MLEFETIGELNAFRILDCDSSVLRFSEQPCEIVYVVDSEPKRHYPDIYVESCYEKQLWDVKADSRAAEPETVARTKLLTEELKRLGFSYRVVPDSEVGRQPRLQNANILLQHGRREIGDLSRERLRLTLQRIGSLTWGAACAGAYGPEGRQVLCRLVLEGILTFDVDQALAVDTFFTCPEGNF